MLEVLEKNQLFAKEFKCCFGRERVEYLGHVISKNIIAVDPKKVNTIANWPLLKNPKALQGFSGLAGYY